MFVGWGKLEMARSFRVGRNANLLNLEYHLLDLAAGKMKFLETEGDPSTPSR
jgi:hypothetical protein